MYCMLCRDTTMIKFLHAVELNYFALMHIFLFLFMAITNSGNFWQLCDGAVPLSGQTGTNRNKPEHGIVLQEKGLTRFCSVFRFILHILALQLQQQVASQEAPATGSGL